MRVLLTKWRRKPAGRDMEGKYVTVTVCVENRAITNLILRLEHHVTQNYKTSQAVQRAETD